MKAQAAAMVILIGLAYGCTTTKEAAEQSDSAAKPATARKITIEETRKMLDEPDVVIIDVRKAGGWMNSDSKIEGAVREDPTLVDSWFEKYPKGKTIILYCS